MRLLSIVSLALALSLPLAACEKKPDPAVAAAVAAKTLAEGQAFMAKQAMEPGVMSLPNGILYKVITAGPPTGASPHVPDEVKVHYEGKLLNGTVFDSSFERGAPATFPLRGLIRAWLIVLPHMKPGDEWQIWVPADMGYGEQDSAAIPANSVLVFRIQLIDFLPTPRATANG